MQMMCQNLKLAAFTGINQSADCQTTIGGSNPQAYTSKGLS
jgi:hypothetical protein